MSAECKGKYEVLRVIRNSILEGLVKCGQYDVRDGEKKCSWNCAEFDPQTFRNLDKVVLLKYGETKRIGWPHTEEKYLQDRDLFERSESWIEEQKWEIHILFKRKTAPVDADTITVEDAAMMLITWFNGPGIDSLRSNRMASLYLSPSSVQNYKDDSGVSQNHVFFPVKIHVGKTLRFTVPPATPKFEDVVPVR